jgi:hypothetical protein
MRLFALLCLFASPALAEDFVPLSGSEIDTALTGRELLYENGAQQDFRASGRTLYNAGRDSWGYWGVREDQYCSMWPPSDIWACYDMARSGNVIRFTGEAGDITVGTYSDPN